MPQKALLTGASEGQNEEKRQLHVNIPLPTNCFN